jgi:hypothetical protein
VLSETTRLALDLGRSAVHDQAERLSDLRTRAGTLLAAASISGSFLGVKHGTLDTITVLALIAYFANVAAVIYTLLPHKLVTSSVARSCYRSPTRSKRQTTRRTRRPWAGSSDPRRQGGHPRQADALVRRGGRRAGSRSRAVDRRLDGLDWRCNGRQAKAAPESHADHAPAGLRHPGDARRRRSRHQVDRAPGERQYRALDKPNVTSPIREVRPHRILTEDGVEREVASRTSSSGSAEHRPRAQLDGPSAAWPRPTTGSPGRSYQAWWVPHSGHPTDVVTAALKA